VIEHVDHLHEHFTEPVEIRAGRYVAPGGAGAGGRMLADSVRRHEYPDGPEWQVGVISAQERGDR
jgi:L-fuconate dehydratase